MAIRTRHETFRFYLYITVSFLIVFNLVDWVWKARTLRAIEYQRRIEIGKRRLSWYLKSEPFPLDEICVYRPTSADELDCDKLINGNAEYIQLIRKNRVTMPEVESDFPVDCVSIHSRGCYTGYPLSQEEASFRLAYAIVVYKDYVLVESIFNAIFIPQNTYCYVLDAKANSAMKTQMRALASCFPNVHVLENEFYLDSFGHNMNEAFLACYEHLLTIEGWKYVISIQNHDMPLRTNRDLVEILKIYNGSNDVEVTRPNTDRVPRKALSGPRKKESPMYSWSLRSLGIVRNKSLNLDEDAEIVLTKGGTATMLTREFIRFTFRDLDLTELLRRLNQRDYTDEMLFSTLHSSDALKAPGGYTSKCLYNQRTVFARGMTRATHWYDRRHCRSNYTRHNICVQGVENLSEMEERHGLFLNKLLPAFDYGAVVCHLTRLMRRKMDPKGWPSILDTSYYNDLPYVRLNRLRKQNKPIDFNTFDCSLLGKDSLL